MKITIQVKTIYGNRVIYPKDETAQAFARIAGTKTLTLEALRLIRALGYEINEHKESFKL